MKLCLPLQKCESRWRVDKTAWPANNIFVQRAVCNHFLHSFTTNYIIIDLTLQHWCNPTPECAVGAMKEAKPYSSQAPVKGQCLFIHSYSCSHWVIGHQACWSSSCLRWPDPRRDGGMRSRHNTRTFSSGPLSGSLFQIMQEETKQHSESREAEKAQILKVIKCECL